MKIALFALLVAHTIYPPKDSTVSIYRRGLRGAVLVEQPKKVYISTPKRKIEYLYNASKIKKVNSKRGVLIQPNKKRTLWNFKKESHE